MRVGVRVRVPAAARARACRPERGRDLALTLTLTLTPTLILNPNLQPRERGLVAQGVVEAGDGVDDDTVPQLRTWGYGDG